MLKYLVIIIFVAFLILYFFFPFGSEDYSQVFLTISTFLFAIFTGFFISRQGRRYSAIRDHITRFDGEMSALYRQCGHLGSDVQEEASEILKDHYSRILTNRAWDFHFVNPSNTLTSLHQLAERKTKDQPLQSLKHLALQRVLTALEVAQVTRKGMIALYHERIPKFQWALVYFLTFILFIAVSTIPSVGFLLSTVLKSAFASSVIFVVILLSQFDQLKFFEGTIGENSAKDVLDILKGEK